MMVMGDDRIVPLSWVRAVMDGSDPTTAEVALEHDDSLDPVPHLEVDAVEGEARRYRARGASARRDELMVGDARLATLAGLVEQRDELDRKIRATVCLLREWEEQPPSLADLAAVTGMSTSGVRSCYTAEDREYVQAVVEVAPRGSRDPQPPTLELPNRHPSQVFLGVDGNGDRVSIPADSSVVVDIPLDDPRRRSIQKLLTIQLADRILTGLPTPSIDDVVAGFDALVECVEPLPQWRYTPVSDPATSAAVVSAQGLPRLRLVATLDGDLRFPPDAPQWLIGHVRDAVAANPGRLYVLRPPARAFRFQWTLTSPGGEVTEVHLASPTRAVEAITLPETDVDSARGAGDGPDQTQVVAGVLAHLVRARLFD